MSNTPSLLPCPFCGGINIIHCVRHMYCHACGADGPDADSQHESEAIAAWNRRTPQPAPDCHHRPPCAECASLTAQKRQP